MFWLFIFALIGSCFSMRQQSVAVRGQLLCGERPAVGVKVKLWDEDDGPDPDDALDEMYTDGNGNFRLQVSI
ncbi:Transthyretin-like family protein [Ostertagia ostertagi]